MPLFGLGKYWDTLVLSPDEQFAVIPRGSDRRIRGLDWLPLVPSGAGPGIQKGCCNIRSALNFRSARVIHI